MTYEADRGGRRRQKASARCSPDGASSSRWRASRWIVRSRALIKLDGADTAILHAVMLEPRGPLGSDGHRVHVHWADRTVGAITDIAYSAVGRPGRGGPPPAKVESVTMLVVPSSSRSSTRYRARSRFLRALRAGTSCWPRNWRSQQVYFCPKAGPGDRGTGPVRPNSATPAPSTFAIINCPVPRAAVKPPYVAACPPGRRRHPVPASGHRDRRGRCPDGHAGAGSVETPRGVGPGIDNID